jgi:thiol-disulfide isomerase/thioredoxin
LTDRHFQPISDTDALALSIEESPALAVWFSGPDCGVCAGLKPKLEALFGEVYPQFQLAEVACAKAPEPAAQHMVFSVPTLIIFFDGRESLRLSRNFSLAVLREKLQRSYDLLFS